MNEERGGKKSRDARKLIRTCIRSHPESLAELKSCVQELESFFVGNLVAIPETQTHAPKTHLGDERTVLSQRAGWKLGHDVHRIVWCVVLEVEKCSEVEFMRDVMWNEIPAML